DAPLRAASAPLCEVDAMRRKWIAPSAVVWLVVAAAFFLLPLIATLMFSLRSIQTNKCCSGAAYWLIVHDHQFWHTIRVSFVLSLDAGFRAIDLHTLTEASQNLGASWRTTLLRVILPNIRAAALGGSFLTLAIVMGEFTIASLAAFKTFPTYIQIVNETQPYEAAALSLVSFLIVWAAMLALMFVGRGRARPAQVAATR